MASYLLPIYNSMNSTTPSPRFRVSNYSTNRFLSTTLLIRRSPLFSGSNPNACFTWCRATTPGGPSPPESGPPNGSDPSSSSEMYGLSAPIGIPSISKLVQFDSDFDLTFGDNDFYPSSDIISEVSWSLSSLLIVLTPKLGGLPATFCRFQDTVQIFFAVLFWMSLFFWASIWDGMDNGRSNKGSRFRK